MRSDGSRIDLPRHGSHRPTIIGLGPLRGEIDPSRSGGRRLGIIPRLGQRRGVVEDGPRTARQLLLPHPVGPEGGAGHERIPRIGRDRPGPRPPSGRRTAQGRDATSCESRGIRPLGGVRYSVLPALRPEPSPRPNGDVRLGLLPTPPPVATEGGSNDDACPSHRRGHPRGDQRAGRRVPTPVRPRRCQGEGLPQLLRVCPGEPDARRLSVGHQAAGRADELLRLRRAERPAPPRNRRWSSGSVRGGA